MKNFKKYVWITIITILCIITIYNYYHYTQMNEITNFTTKIETKRLASANNVFKFTGKLINNCNLKDVVTTKDELVSFKNPTLLIMLSGFGCSRCQNRELQNINKYISNQKDNKISIIAIGNTNDRDILLKLKKLVNIDIPMYFDNVSSIFDLYKNGDI